MLHEEQVAVDADVILALPYFPAGQINPEHLEAPADSEYVPGGQSMQVELPAVSECLPGLQSTHTEATAAPEICEYLPIAHARLSPAPPAQ